MGKLEMGFTIAGVFALAFIAPTIGALMGAISGWVVGLIFGEPILKVLAGFGLNSVKMWEFGCFLGFVGGFFKASLTTQRDS